MMFTTLQPLILASSSPRRQHFLRQLGINYTVVTAEIDETPLSGEQPDIFAMRMARCKAEAVAGEHRHCWIIGADTVVTLADGTILGKPRDEAEALSMLRRLNNATHRVMTGMYLGCLDQQVSKVILETSEVTFTDTPEDVLLAYIATGEPMDKAGAYGIQGLGSFLVSSISGSCTNVIGLPVSKLIEHLLSFLIIRPSSPSA